MWLFLPIGFFSVVWCEHPDRMEHEGANARPLFPDGAMMIRARTFHHLEHLQCDLVDALVWAMKEKPDVYRDVCDRWGVDAIKTSVESLGIDMRLDEALHEAVVTMFPILEQPGSDYQWRIFMERDVFALFMEWRSRTIDYSNFKKEAGKSTLDPEYLNALHRVWSVMYGLQGGPVFDEADLIKAFAQTGGPDVFET